MYHNNRYKKMKLTDEPKGQLSCKLQVQGHLFPLKFIEEMQVVYSFNHV